MWSRTSQQREIFTKLSHLPSSQRICSSLLTRMARVLVQSARRPVLSSRGMVLLSWGRILCRHSIKLPRHQAQLCQYSECGQKHPSKGRSSPS